MANKTYLEVLNWASSFLEENGQEKTIAKYLLMERYGFTLTEWISHLPKQVPEEDWLAIQDELQRIIQHEPVQYVLGHAPFYGEDFIVNEHTLIPRPETEELVDLAIQTFAKELPLKVVDVGTGTGIIGITLKKQCPNWQVTAVDISKEALEVACQNAEKLGVSVQFVEGNLLEPIEEPIDLLIANPPYISFKEWEEMDESVRTHEPAIALYAANDGLAIYQQLAKQIQGKLAENGGILLEVGYQQGKAVQEIFQQVFPEKHVKIHQDLAGKDRMISVC